MVEQGPKENIGNSLYAGKENARIYDVVYGMTEREDIPFWLNLASQLKPQNILEIGVGTGRVAIPLAESGFNVTGIDIEKSMLDIACEKTSKLPKDIKQRLSFIRGDAHNFNLNRQFDLIIVTFNTFYHFMTEKEQVNVLKNVRKHLEPKKGVLVLDMFNSLVKAAWEWDSSEKGKIPENRPPFKEFLSIDTKKGLGVYRAIRDYIDHAYNHKRLFIDRQSKIYKLASKKLLAENRVLFEIPLHNIIDVQYVLFESGFESTQVIGDYEGHPSLDGAILTSGTSIKGAPSEKVIIVTGPGERRFKPKPISVEEAERIKNSRRDIGLEIIINGKVMPPELRDLLMGNK